MGLKETRNPVLYSYSMHTYQCISYLTGPQCPLEIYCLSGRQCLLKFLCVCAHAQLGLREFNKDLYQFSPISLDFTSLGYSD